MANLKEFGHGPVVEALRAVEDDTLLGHRLGQVFAGLRLASSGRTFGSTAQGEAKGSHQGPGGRYDVRVRWQEREGRVGGHKGPRDGAKGVLGTGTGKVAIKVLGALGS